MSDTESRNNDDETSSVEEIDYEARMNELIDQIQDILIENSESVHNCRKDSIREKADYYTSLADRLDDAISELQDVIDHVEGDVSAAQKLIDDVNSW
jgi:predicted  nucleic acid-binding Zn-ribbon protein